MVDYIGWAVDVKTDTNLAQYRPPFPTSDRSEAAKKPSLSCLSRAKGAWRILRARSPGLLRDPLSV